MAELSSSNLVAELRSANVRTGNQDLCRRAANEVERLTAELAAAIEHNGALVEIAKNATRDAAEHMRKQFGLTGETRAVTRELSATERLHNICDALSEQANESPFTREEWERIDAQTVQMQEQIRVASHALSAIAGGDIYPQKLAREALDLMRGAVKAPAASESRKTRYCDYDLCPATFDPAHSNNDH